MHHAHDGRQRQQCEQQCYHAGADAERYCLVALQTVLAHDGVGNERVARHDAAEQQCRLLRVAHHADAGKVHQHEGRQERQQTECQHLSDVLSQALHVHLQSCEEHDVVESYLSEEFERVVALQDVQPVLSHNDSREHHSDDVRNAEPVHHHRCHQYNDQHNEKYPCAVSDREI